MFRFGAKNIETHTDTEHRKHSQEIGIKITKPTSRTRCACMANESLMRACVLAFTLVLEPNMVVCAI